MKYIDEWWQKRLLSYDWAEADKRIAEAVEAAVKECKAKPTGQDDYRPRVVRGMGGLYLTGHTEVLNDGTEIPIWDTRDKAYIYTSYIAYNEAHEYGGEVVFVENER